MFMSSHISDIIYSLGKDVSIQVLYNRALTQLGMAAFRIGNFEECHDILIEVCQGGQAKLKEILAQGIPY